MGNTWVVYIENSKYKNMPALTSLGMGKMRKAFAKYDAQRTVVKKNLTKTELERFFNIELRDLVRRGQVNTLLVWYEGHGRSQGGKAYWIPVDGKADDVYSFYNYGPLKGLMENYSESVRTTLVVSDASGNDPSFYELTRRSHRTCNLQDHAHAHAKDPACIAACGSRIPRPCAALFLREHRRT